MASRTRLLWWLYFGVLFLYVIVRFGILQVQPPGLVPNDFVTFLRVTERFLEGRSIYEGDDSSPFKYFPAFAFYFSHTLGRLSPKISWFFWCFASSLLYFSASATLLARVPLIWKLSPVQLVGVLALGTFSGWHGLLEHQSYGQGDFILFGLIFWSFLARSEIASALLASLLPLFKPQAAVLWVVFLLLRRKKAAALTPLFSLAWLLLPLPFLGAGRFLHLTQGWAQVMRSQNPTFLSGNLNQNLGASLSRIFQDSAHAPTWIAAASLLGCLALVLVWWKLDRARRISSAGTTSPALLLFTVVLAYLVLNPIGWRWMTFVWTPVFVLVATILLTKHSSRGLQAWLGAHLVVVLFLQQSFARLLGIHEIDELSRYGFYTWGTLTLLCATVCALAYSSVSSISSASSSGINDGRGAGRSQRD